jgi:Zn-dependent protease
LSNAHSGIQVWDITSLDAISRMPATLNGNVLSWKGTQSDGIHEYVAVDVNGTQWVHADIIGAVANQDLHRLSNIDYVIICPEGYEAVSEELARAHEEKQSITWAVVTDQQVYNEFSSGTPDATAYRWLMKMLYDRADGNGIAAPRWLLLMGHSTYDNRKLLSTSGESLLLCYEAKNSTNEVNAYESDDYFAFLDDNEGESDATATMDIGVGRLPVSSTDEARAAIGQIYNLSLINLLPVPVLDGGHVLVFAIEAMVTGFFSILGGDAPGDTLGGPMMMYRVASVSGERGWESFLLMLALISVNLGLINLLPIPMLDGGHLLVFAVEGVRRRPLTVLARERVQLGGLIVVGLITVLALRNDVMRFFFQ